jgi:ubiquinone biosynthesis accessory factor UbiJ
MAIKALLMTTIEAALNKYLSLDSNIDVLLTPLAGKVIAVSIQPFNETLYLCPAKDSIQIIDQHTDQPDTTISGSAWALGLMGLSEKPMRSVFSGEILIEGDIQTGKKFQELFKKLDINLEDLLAQYTGSDIANRISQFFRSGQEWGKESIETFKMNTSEFLQEETRDLPAKPEIDSHHQQIDALRAHFDRLNSRVEKLADLLTTKQE